VHGKSRRQLHVRVPAVHSRAVSDRVDGRVDEHVHGCVWDVHTTVYMARYGRVHGPRPQRALSARVHGRVGLPAMYTTVYWPCTVYTDVYMARTRPFNCGVDVCTCRTAVLRPSYTAVCTAVNGL